MNCDVGEVRERSENELCSISKLIVISATSQLILQPYRRFTYVAVHSPTLLSLLLRQRFSLTSSGESPMELCSVNYTECR